jgi:DNA-binding NarL/FixJ family response regulator
VSKVRVLIADDHEVVRRGLRGLIESHPGWRICGEATTGREAVEKSKELKPDVVVMDITMPELNGLDATRQILKAVPRTQVLILTIHASEQLVHDVVAAGARGYVLKSDAGRDLVAAIEALAHRKPFFTPTLTEMVLRGLGKPIAPGKEPMATHSPLSPREREIVQLLAEGKSNKEVATALNISVNTVETHRANIMLKLDLHSISDLVHYAIRNKIVEA